MWTLLVVQNRRTIEIGAVKIGDFESNLKPAVPAQFSNIPQQFFSLGQDEDYYETLNRLGPNVRDEILTGLRDVARDLTLFSMIQNIPVTQQSLLRSVKAVTVQSQLHRIARGGVRLSPYAFSYHSPEINRYGSETPPCTLEFEVDPQENPRTNIHVLIGSNGVGKSFTLNDIAIALIRPGESRGTVDFHRSDADELLTSRFANVVSVAYSAFDAFERIPQSADGGAMSYRYIGLKKETESHDTTPRLKNHIDLESEFGSSLREVRDARRLDRLKSYLDILTSDPLFAGAVERLSGMSYEDLENGAGYIFRDLSSGHKIVLLTLTRLVELVEEATLVLIDEPESHLHPPLLSAFMGALSQIVEDRNGVAIMATHSPVVVQEVPSNCVWKLFGSGSLLTAQRAMIETYGENVGTLTQEVFGLQVSASGFHKALFEAAQSGNSYEQILAAFGNRLGAEARALLQSMVYFAAGR